MAAVLLVGMVGVAQGSKLVDSIVDTYKRVLVETGDLDPSQLGRDGKLGVKHLVALMNLIDDDTHCGKWCHQYFEQWFDGRDTIFEPVVDAIYGDMISDDPYEPQEIHLSLTGDETEMKVMWLTDELLEDPFVEYRAKNSGADSPWERSPAIHFTYEVPKKWWPTFEGVIYEADMTGLVPDAAVEYRVRGYDSANATDRASADFNFKAAPVNGADPDRTTRVSVMADQGTFMLLGFATQQKLAQMMDELSIDYATVVGDLSYAGLSSAMPRLNISKEDEFSHVWDLYGIQSQAVAATRPWMLTNGNHERFYNFTAFRHRYHMPHEASQGSLDNFWYSYDYGNIHWVSVSSEHDLEEGSPQRTFIERDLAAAADPARRAAVPWIVLSIHKPLYCSVQGTPGGYADLLEDLVLQYDVDMVLSGHMHAYERVHPVVKGVVSAYPDGSKGVDIYYSEGKGPVHVIQGNTGGMQFERFDQPQPSWSALRMSNGFIPPNNTREADVGSYGPDSSSSNSNSGQVGFERRDHDRVPEEYNYQNTFGFGLITAHNATHLEYDSIPISGEIGADNFWVVKHQ